MIRMAHVSAWLTSQAKLGLLAWSLRRGADVWPEPWYSVGGATLLGALAWLAFTTRIPDITRTPVEMLFTFLGLYFYSVGYLSGRRTGSVSSGGWAGAIAGLAFGIAACLEIYTTAVREGVRESVRAGSLDQMAIALSGLAFFIAIGAVCGALGAKKVTQAYRHAADRQYD